MSKAVHLALDVLELLERTARPMRLTEIGAALGQAKATTHRALATLEQRGYLVQLVDGRYRLGMRCLALGGAALDGLDLRSVARAHLEELNDATREMVLLAVYERGDVVYVDKVDSQHAVAPKARVGTRAPAVAVSTGRALLAHQAPAEVERLVAAGLESFTTRSVSEPQTLRDLLEDVRAEGVARNDGSWREGVCGVAAPVKDHTGMVVASVGCCLPESRFSDERRRGIEEAVRRAAEGISHGLGHRVPATGGVM